MQQNHLKKYIDVMLSSLIYNFECLAIAFRIKTTNKQTKTLPWPGRPCLIYLASSSYSPCPFVMLPTCWGFLCLECSLRPLLPSLSVRRYGGWAEVNWNKHNFPRNILSDPATHFILGPFIVVRSLRTMLFLLEFSAVGKLYIHPITCS